MKLTLTQAAEKLGVTDYRLAQLADAGMIPCAFNGNAARKFRKFEEKDIRDYKKQLNGHAGPLNGHATQNPVVTIAEAAQQIGVSPRAVHKRIKRNLIPVVAHGVRNAAMVNIRDVQKSFEVIPKRCRNPKVGPVLAVEGQAPAIDDPKRTAEALYLLSKRVTANTERISALFDKLTRLIDSLGGV